MVDIKIQINTELTWEADELLERIDTVLYKEVGGGKVTLYAEMEDDIGIIPQEIQKIRSKAEEIRRMMA